MITFYLQVLWASEHLTYTQNPGDFFKVPHLAGLRRGFSPRPEAFSLSFCLVLRIVFFPNLLTEVSQSCSGLASCEHTWTLNV